MPVPSWEPRSSAGIAGVGVSLPDAVVDNELLAERLGVEPGWIARRTGIHSRHVAGEGELLVDHAVMAARGALERAGVLAAEVDLVVVATTTPDHVLPNMAPLVVQRLGAVRAGGFDVGAACAGFISGLAVGAAQIEAGRMARVVVVGADFMSRVTDPADRSTAVVFADGAGAAVLVPVSDGGGLGPFVLGTDGLGESLITLEHGGTVRMNGQDVFRAAVARLAEVTVQAAARAGVAMGDIDLFVYHQANGRILHAVAERLGLDRGRVIDCISEYGNTSAATLPLALTYAQERQLLVPGDHVLLAAFGAGFTWGATVCRWGEP